MDNINGHINYYYYYYYYYIVTWGTGRDLKQQVPTR